MTDPLVRTAIGARMMAINTRFLTGAVVPTPPPELTVQQAIDERLRAVVAEALAAVPEPPAAIHAVQTPTVLHMTGGPVVFE